MLLSEEEAGCMEQAVQQGGREGGLAGWLLVRWM